MSKPGVQQGSSYASVHKQTRYFSTAITCLQNNHRHSYKPLPCQHLSIAPLHFLPLANQIMKMPRLMEYIEYIYELYSRAIYILVLIAYFKYYLLPLSVSMCCFNMFQWHLHQFLCIKLHQILCKLKHLIDFSNHQIPRKSHCKSKLYL